MVGLRGLVLAVAVLLALAAQAGAESGAQARHPARATAYAVKVLLPNQEPIVAGLVGGRPGTRAVAVPFAYPEDGSIVRAESVAGRSTAATSSAQARADLRMVSLFGGEITVEAVVAHSAASSVSSTGHGTFDATSISKLTVLGQPVEPAPDLRVPLGDWGHLTLLQERTRAIGAASNRGWVTVLDVRLDADHDALPVGTRILVGYAEASATRRKAAGAPARALEPTVSAPPAPAASVPAPRPRIRRGLGYPPDVARPGTTGPSSLVRIAPKVIKRLTAHGYVFPVYGPSGFGDTFGAPRADTIWHHGDDIFAALGAPVLAVSDGTTFSVGRNPIGGNRLWLRDRSGNEFYYAHLSAFSPLAVNGGHVNAGDVVGFVGNTGDAENTPYHLHFEIHPSSLLFLGYDGVVNPTPYLRAWQHVTDIDFPSAAVWAPTVVATGRAPAPGAVLLQSSDISAASGLDPGSLRRALAPASSGRDGALVNSAKRPSPKRR
jgi:murein DD-endopeptidase MepM/ murein hydrolase activator NlpD